jgi:hypothetical protein
MMIPHTYSFINNLTHAYSQCYHTVLYLVLISYSMEAGVSRDQPLLESTNATVFEPTGSETRPIIADRVPLNVRNLHSLLFGAPVTFLVLFSCFGCLRLLQLIGCSAGAQKFAWCDCRHAQSDLGPVMPFVVLISGIIEPFTNIPRGNDLQAQDAFGTMMRRVAAVEPSRSRQVATFLSSMAWVLWACIIGAAITFIFQADSWDPPFASGTPVSLRVFLQALSVWCQLTGYAQIVWLSLIWIWQCFCFHIVGRNFIEHGLTPEALTSGAAACHFVQLLEDQADESDRWTINHGIRLVSSTWHASALLAQSLWLVEKHEGHFRAAIGLFAVSGIVYLTVWASALAPGAAQDRLFNGVLRRLLLQTVSGQQPVDMHSAPYEQAMHLMQRAVCLRGSAGLTFAGVTMSLQKATTIFTVTSYVLIQELRYGRYS